MVYVLNDGSPTYKGKPYLKSPSDIMPLPSMKYITLLLGHAGICKIWETLPANNHGIDDLDHDEIIRTFKIGLREGRIPEDEYTEDAREILTHLDLIDGEIINNAAMILFAKKLPGEYCQCFLRMGRFIDDIKIEGHGPSFSCTDQSTRI